MEKVQKSSATGSAYGGRQGVASEAVEQNLVRKELLLREKEKQLHDEKMMLLRQTFGTHPARASTSTAEGKNLQRRNLKDDIVLGQIFSYLMVASYLLATCSCIYNIFPSSTRSQE